MCSVLFVCENLQLSGFKKVLNYAKKVVEDVRFRKMVSREEVIFGFLNAKTFSWSSCFWCADGHVSVLKV